MRYIVDERGPAEPTYDVPPEIKTSKRSEMVEELARLYTDKPGLVYVTLEANLIRTVHRVRVGKQTIYNHVDTIEVRRVLG